ncbi:arsenic resistance protein [Legionella jordanis]|uniref:arsenic resistance protein n=1 Tax=Legionella jordanis TaxID=456 RepID=UPI000EFB2495|nr:arsenic resistance protein [Legionella jordanis]RMW99902.1 arsenic resistance protein [Legionella jordanis]
MLRKTLESQQIGIYFGVIVVAVVIALTIPGTTILEVCINPALALMLFVTFLQIPIPDLGRGFAKNYLAALLVTNFVVLPFFVAGLVQLLTPSNPMVLLGLYLVLLTPCIDYVVTFSQLGDADARLILAATPILLIMQMMLLPVYIHFLVNEEAVKLIYFKPFFHAFIWLIVLPLIFAALMQLWAARYHSGKIVLLTFGLLPVPATALVLFVVIAAVLPQAGSTIQEILQVFPIYIVFAFFAPLIGWFVAKFFKLNARAGRAVAFSAGTRNSLVVLPLAFAIPHAIPILPAVIVTQTLIELISELGYVRLISKLGSNETVSR